MTAITQNQTKNKDIADAIARVKQEDINWEIDPLLDTNCLHQDDTAGYVCIRHKDEKGKWEETWHEQRELRYVLRSYIGKVDFWISQASFYVFTHKNGRKEHHRRISNAKGIRCFFVDLDYQKSEKYRDCQPEYVTECLLGRLSAYGLPTPSLVVSSGNGLQVKWVLERPLYISQPEILAFWNAMQEFLLQFLAEFGADFQARDAARILRIPGTVNGKDNVAFDRVVRTIYYDGEPIDFDDFLYEVQAREFPSDMEKEQIAQETVSKAIMLLEDNGIDVFRLPDNKGDEIPVERYENDGKNEPQPHLELIFDKDLTPEQRELKLTEFQRAAESTVVDLHKSLGWWYRKDVSALLLRTKNGRKASKHYPLYRLKKVIPSCIGGEDYCISLCEFKTSQANGTAKDSTPRYIEACLIPMDYRNTKYAEQTPEEVAHALNAHLSSMGIPLPSLIIYAGGYKLEALYFLRSPIKMYQKSCFDRWQAVQKYLVKSCRDFGATSVSSALACSVHIPGTINTKALADGLDPVVKIVFAKDIDNSDVNGGRTDFELLCQALLPYDRLQVHAWRAKAKSKRSEHKIVLAAGVNSTYLPLYRARIDDLRAILENRKVNGELPKGSRQTMLHLIMNFRCLAGEISSANFTEEAKKEAHNISAGWATHEFRLSDLSTLRREVRNMERGVLSTGKKNWFYIYGNQKLINLLALAPEEMRSLRSIKPLRTPEEKREARRIASRNYRLRHGVKSRERNIAALSRQTGIPYPTLYRYYVLLGKVKGLAKSYCDENGKESDLGIVLKFIVLILNLLQLCKAITTLEEYSTMAIKTVGELLPSWAEKLEPERLVAELETIGASLKLRKATGHSSLYTLSEGTLERAMQSLGISQDEEVNRAAEAIEGTQGSSKDVPEVVFLASNKTKKKTDKVRHLILVFKTRASGRQRHEKKVLGFCDLRNKGSPCVFG